MSSIGPKYIRNYTDQYLVTSNIPNNKILVPGMPGTCVCQNVDSVLVVGPQPSQPRVAEQTPVQYPSYEMMSHPSAPTAGTAYGKR